MPGSAVDAAGAAITITAPMPRVLAVLEGYRRYAEVFKRIDTSRVLARGEDGSRVYLRAPIMRGMYGIWLVARFAPARRWRRHGLVIRAERLRGNVEHFAGSWKLAPCGPKRTVLRGELWLEVPFPIPSSLITPELMRSCARAVTKVKRLSECG
ncbi:MAG: hypothetical protein KC731_37700 [Myxococcales bacterium]|nr:hypothetical protein [Myxococcales bacterium]